MLVLSRKSGERIVIPSCELTVIVLAIEGTMVWLGITAPQDIEVYLEEVLEQGGCRRADSPAGPRAHARKAVAK